MKTTRLLITLSLILAMVPASAPAFVPPGSSPAAEHAFRLDTLHIPTAFRPPQLLDAALGSGLEGELAQLGVAPGHGFFDLRSGRWGTLIQRVPLAPGDGNGLDWDELGVADPSDQEAVKRAVWESFAAHLAANQALLGVELDQIEPAPTVTLADGGRLIQINARRVVDGVPVRRSFLTAVINNGNLVLYGLRNWGPMDLDTSPTVGLDDAGAALAGHLGSLPIDDAWRKPRLAIQPLAVGPDALSMVPGTGLDYRLVWVLSPAFAGDNASWEALVDAHSGALLAFQDTNNYLSVRQVVGGVLPVSNDEVAPDGVEQPRWPMPFIDFENGGNRYVGDSGGNAPLCLDGPITTHLDSRFVRMLDRCQNPNTEELPEPMTLTNDALVSDNIDLGVAPPFGTNCTAPTSSETPSASAALGNTRASRSGFYELNKLMEQARGQLPGNPWIYEQLTANMNIAPNESNSPTEPAICNAFWNGSTVNFYQSSAVCNNTGEIAAVFDHEWGHGMDHNDANPTISNPGEGIADIYAFLRLNTSCIGRNFSNVLGCADQTGADPCKPLMCNGVRDIDYSNRASEQPHDVAWAEANCGTGSTTPCGGGTHCEGAIYGEAVWDLTKRDLPCLGAGWVDNGGGIGECAGGAAPVMDDNTALELVTRLSYQAAGPVGDWFQCVTDGTAGCNADGGYLNYLAADDDDGDLSNGTPHMSAIFDAFDRHQIACRIGPDPVPAVLDGGCAGGPTQAPTLTADPIDRGAKLSWTPVAGATTYEIFRTEGVFGCEFGKTKIGSTTDLEFIDNDGLSNGFEYYYTVAAVGDAPSCLGPMSACTTVVPAAGPNLSIDEVSVAATGITGDGDISVDNCELSTLSFDVHAIGTGTQTGVRIVDVVPLSHPATEIATTFPLEIAASMADCDIVQGGFDFTAKGLAFGDVLVFRVDYTSNELAGRVKSQELAVALTESDFQAFASKTFAFEGTLEDWSRVRGTWNIDSQIPGAQATASFLSSSANLADQCDQIVSPVVRLEPTSTLSLHNQYDIEGEFTADLWYDRANVGLIDFSSGLRTPVAPDSGRPYDVPDGSANGTCETSGQAGWAGTSPDFGTAAGWAESGWSAGALGSAGVAGDLVQLSVYYGTDPGTHLKGFWFDQVTLTDFELQILDAQPNTCAGDANQPPVAGDDAASVRQDLPVTIAVLANDSDPEGDPLSIVAVGAAANGGAVANPDGTITYTPNPGFVGTDSFTYTISDGELTASATVTVTVTANQPPLAADDEASTHLNTAVIVAVLANDSDGDGDSLAITAVSDPAGGFATALGDGTISYTPDPGFSGFDTFTYTISDGLASATATVTVFVEADCPPETIFFDDVEGSGAAWTQTAGPTDLAATPWFVTDFGFHSPTVSWFVRDEGTLKDRRLETASPIAIPAGGELRLSFWHDFELEAGFDGGVLEYSLDGTVWNDILDGDLLSGIPANPGRFLQNGYNDDISLTWGSAISGRAAWSGASGGFVQTVVDLADFGGHSVLFRYRAACDLIGDAVGWFVDDVLVTRRDTSAACSVGLTANADSAETDQGVAVTIDVLANDSSDNGGMQVESATDPANGSVAINPDETVTYTPDPGFAGIDQFDYVVCDSSDACATATVTVTVNETVNRAPVAEDDATTTDQGVAVTIDVLANDSDPDGDPIRVGDFGQPANGTVTANPDGTLTYTPDPAFVGVDSFTYQACDNRTPQLCDGATVTVTVEPDPTTCPGNDGDSDSDDDDFDDDCVRDDEDSDDDNDGDSDNSDSDDDNDGDSDDSDSDDDNDGIRDEFDSESARESATRVAGSYAGQLKQYSIEADTATLLLVALVEGAGAETLDVAIFDPSGLQVATSASAAGRALATTVPLAAGVYTVEVTGPAGSAVDFDLTLLTRRPW